MRSFAVPAGLAALLASTALGHASTLGTVFYIDMENHNLTQPNPTSSPEQIMGNPAAPYLNSLMTPGNPNAAQTSWASDYTNVAAGIHPSEPNYIWQEAGSNFGVNSDADPGTGSGNGIGGKNLFTQPSLTALMQQKGVTWTSYQEDMQFSSHYAVNGVPTTSASGTSLSYTNPYNGSHQYNFAVKHDGSLFFTATNGA